MAILIFLGVLAILLFARAYWFYSQGKISEGDNNVRFGIFSALIMLTIIGVTKLINGL